MRAKTVLAAALTAIVPTLFLVMTAGPAPAHVLKTVGPYHMLIGFGTEPTYAGLENSVFLLLTDAKTGTPIVDEGLGDTLKVEVEFGNQKMQLPLQLSFDPDSGQGTKGVYNAVFLPTDVGDYTFHFFGSIKRQKVDLSVTSSPTTFDSAHDPAGIEFPEKAPSNVNLGKRLEAETARLTSAVERADGKAAPAASARTLAIVGIAVGAFGVVVGAVALRRGAALARRAAAGVGSSGS